MPPLRTPDRRGKVFLMVMYARSDELEIKCEARPGASHVRPHKTRDPESEFVAIWGIDCKPCESGHLKANTHWAKNRFRIPLTPDEEQEARDAIDDAARMDAQIKLMEARARPALPRLAVHRGPGRAWRRPRCHHRRGCRLRKLRRVHGGRGARRRGLV
jgi:hypothetical protein